MELAENERSYREQRSSFREGLILMHKPELLGELAEIAGPEVCNEESIRKFQSRLALRSEKIAGLPEDAVAIDFHIYQIRTDEGKMEVVVDYLWDILECSYSGSKKAMKRLKRISRDIYLYYGVTEHDVESKSKRYSSLVTILTV